MKLHAVTLLACCLLLIAAPSGFSGITVSPGNTDPVYPPATPDPWVVSTLNLGGIFSP